MDSQPVPGLTATSRTATPRTTTQRGVVLESSGAALLDDLAFAAEVGMQHVRFDLSWKAAQSRANAFNGEIFEQATAAALAARNLGMQPWFRLLQVESPHWFEDEGGFTDAGTAGRWWPRWVQVAAEQLGAVAAGWVPFEAPVAMTLRIEPNDARRRGELINTLMIAWRDAWRILRGGPLVATSLDVTAASGTADGFRAAWLEGLADGTVRISGRGDRPLADFADSCDVVGLLLRSDVGSALQHAAARGPDKPLAVTFRPLGDTDTERAECTQTMWKQVRATVSDRTVAMVTITPFLDDPVRPDRPGIATANRRLKDNGEAFLAG
jgi:hypothetical protein